MTTSLAVVARCVRLASTLQPYLEGEVTDPEVARTMADHLEECRRCGLEAETWTSLKVALAARTRPAAARAGEAGEARAAVERLQAFARSLVEPPAEAG